MSLLTGLSGYWKFDGNGNDSTGINNATPTGGAFSVPAAKLVQGFDASSNPADASAANAYVDIPFPNVGTGDFSISVWGNLFGDNGLTSNLIHYENDGAGATNLLEIGSTAGNYEFFLRGPEGADQYISSAGMTYNAWHHFVLTRDGTSLKGYIDGVNIGTISSVPLLTFDSVNRYACRRYNSSYTGSQQSWRGYADEIGMWSRALTPTEVTDLYNAGVGIQYPFGATGWIATDDFESYPGNVGMGGLNGGSGWTGTWVESGTLFSATNVNPPVLQGTQSCACYTASPGVLQRTFNPITSGSFSFMYQTPSISASDGLLFLYDGMFPLTVSFVSGSVILQANGGSTTIGTYVANTSYTICIRFNGSVAAGSMDNGVTWSANVTAPNSGYNIIYIYNSLVATYYLDAFQAFVQPPPPTPAFTGGFMPAFFNM
jgi:hypothetical protein